MNRTAELDELIARLEDLCAEAARGGVGVSDFLSPREAHYADRYLRQTGTGYMLFGGYDGAERQRAYVLPDYMEAVSSMGDMADFGFDCDVRALLISTDGYARLSHRDYLGSILGMGIERSVIGDILVYDEGGKEAVVLCTQSMATYLCSELTRIAREKAKVKEIDISTLQPPERRVAAISDTVASPRLDCIVGAICSMSREKARETVESGLVEVDFECSQRADKDVVAPCVVSVRGFGRYRILSVSDKTRKGRFRLSAEKFL